MLTADDWNTTSFGSALHDTAQLRMGGTTNPRPTGPKSFLLFHLMCCVVAIQESCSIM